MTGLLLTAVIVPVMISINSSTRKESEIKNLVWKESLFCLFKIILNIPMYFFRSAFIIEADTNKMDFLQKNTIPKDFVNVNDKFMQKIPFSKESSNLQHCPRQHKDALIGQNEEKYNQNSATNPENRPDILSLSPFKEISKVDPQIAHISSVDLENNLVNVSNSAYNKVSTSKPNTANGASERTKLYFVNVSYKPTREDELELIPGNTITWIKATADEGWAIGRDGSGKVGAFPTVCCKSL
ncbi:hypothetical protein HK099_004727 [Clydaea vesicula]|uniref:SH3 domain-containing protein n=1 Tax=Clydaea vesicula TaxID=447962 RepID=A0AAD5TZX6_9FUNG|nr:hypothetical protein HK099_004727 [Clydaea vesicula]